MRIVHWEKTRPKCSECNKEFETMDELNEHRQVHRMSCGVCDKTFLVSGSEQQVSESSVILMSIRVGR